MRILVPALLCATLASAASAQFLDFKGYTGFDVGSTRDVRFPTEMQLADLNGDGKRDIALVSNSVTHRRFAVMLNQGDDTFGAPVFLPLAAGAVDLAVADLDRDGDLDVAVAEGGGTRASGQTVAVFANSGRGAFALAQRIAVGSGPTGIAAGDVDGDGDQDLAVTLYGVSGSGTAVRLLLNAGNAAFALGATATVAPAPYGIRAGDLNGDGRADLAVVHDNDVLTLLLAQGTSFATPIVFDVRATTTGGAHLFPCVGLADLDRDGDLDIAFSDNNHQKQIPLLRGIVSVVENRGGGAFALDADIVLRPYQSGFTDLAFADLNGDGWLDLLGVDPFDWDYVLSDGHGGFAAPAAPTFGLIASDQPSSVVALDADHDGDLDALVLGSHSNAVTIHRFENGEPLAQPMFQGPDGDLDTADLDGDGDLDIVAGGGGPIFVSINTGTGAFAPAVTYPSGAFNGPTAVKLADFDHDARPDLLIGSLSGFNTRRNLGNGTFGGLVQWNMPSCGASDIDAVDLDNDGNPDVVVPESAGCAGRTGLPRVFIAAGRGDGTFVPPVTFDAQWLTERLTHADLNQDGNQDLILTGNTTLEVYFGNGDLTFRPRLAVPADFAPHGIAAADFDGNGVLDLACCNWGDINDDGIEESMTVMLGIDGTSFAPPQLYAASPSWDLGSAVGINAADIDRDGDIDLAVTNYDGHDLSLWKNRGDGTFVPAGRVGGLREVTDALLADFTGDGIVDAVLAGNPWTPSVPPSLLLLAGLSDDPWLPIGSGIAGALGFPHLDGDGALVGGNTLRLRLDDALPNGSGIHVIGTAVASSPFLGGVLVPVPALVLPFVADNRGSALLPLTLPPFAIGGFDLVAQSWVLDPAATNGLASASAGTFAHAR